jgi:hypothetical protein
MNRIFKQLIDQAEPNDPFDTRSKEGAPLFFPSNFLESSNSRMPKPFVK